MWQLVTSRITHGVTSFKMGYKNKWKKAHLKWGKACPLIFSQIQIILKNIKRKYKSWWGKWVAKNLTKRWFRAGGVDSWIEGCLLKRFFRPMTCQMKRQICQNRALNLRKRSRLKRNQFQISSRLSLLLLIALFWKIKINSFFQPRIPDTNSRPQNKRLRSLMRWLRHSLKCLKPIQNIWQLKQFWWVILTEATRKNFWNSYFLSQIYKF